MRKLAFLVTVALVTAVAATGASASSARTAGAKCGGGITASLTPHLTGYYDFTLVCIQHDKCYAHFGVQRGQCDTAFIANMLAECAHAYPTENNAQRKRNSAKRHSCEYVAGRYHIAVVRNGEKAYEKAPKQAVTDIFNGDYTGQGSVTATVTTSDGSSFPDTEQFPNPVATVADGMVSGTPLAITPDPPLSATATASATYSFTGFSGDFTITYIFSYSSTGGSVTVQATISGSGNDGQGDTVTLAGSLSGSKSVSG